MAGSNLPSIQDEELNDFPPKFRKKIDFQADFERKRPIEKVMDQMIS
jgi:hypothetical protein